MLRNVNAQDAPTIMTDDEEAVEHAERNRCAVKKSMAAIASRWFRRNASQRLARSGSLGARFIQREIVLSESSKPSMRSSPWIRGAPQVGFSATIRKRSEEHTSELQSHHDLVCRLLLEKKKKQ